MGKGETPAYRLIPAASFHCLTPAFDLVCAVMGLGARFTERVVRTVRVPLNARVLDAGCGSGRVALAVKFRSPDAEVIGLDGDPQILTLARRKADRRDQDVEFFEGLIEAVPFPDESFDLVFTVLVLHHLPEKAKVGACREMFRVVRPGGRVIIADFGPPHGWRATFSTVMNEAYPADRHVIDLMLAHAPKDKTEAAYNRAVHLPRRRELGQVWANKLLEGAVHLETVVAGRRK